MGSNPARPPKLPGGVNLLSPQQLNLVDLREARAKVKQRARIMHFVPYAISWTIMLWILACVGLWIMAMLAGCASIIHGQFEEVGVSSNPPGATVWINSDQEVVTPAVVSLRRGDSYTFVFSKDGYEQGSAVLSSQLSGWVFGNLLLTPPFAVVGAVVDLSTGAVWSLSRDSVHVTLKKEN